MKGTGIKVAVVEAPDSPLADSQGRIVRLDLGGLHLLDLKVADAVVVAEDLLEATTWALGAAL